MLSKPVSAALASASALSRSAAATFAFARAAACAAATKEASSAAIRAASSVASKMFLRAVATLVRSNPSLYSSGLTLESAKAATIASTSSTVSALAISVSFC